VRGSSTLALTWQRERGSDFRRPGGASVKSPDIPAPRDVDWTVGGNGHLDPEHPAVASLLSQVGSQYGKCRANGLGQIQRGSQR
jgi:hypothetical protein